MELSSFSHGMSAAMSGVAIFEILKGERAEAIGSLITAGIFFAIGLIL